VPINGNEWAADTHRSANVFFPDKISAPFSGGIYMKRFGLLLVGVLVLSQNGFAVQPDKKTLPIGLTPDEQRQIRPDTEPPMTQAPAAPVHSLAEWEEPEAVMTLWPNASWISALAQHGPVKLFADDRSSQGWWQNWLQSNQISQSNISYFIAQTNSIWIRDYGPWFIVDGHGDFGIVGIQYNRPRPLDNLIPGFLARELDLPLFQPGLVHTGGNYYNDSIGNAFSSTLVYTENSRLEASEVDARMNHYLGIEHYWTSPLAPQLTIEHLDTFGKLVAPDTFVFSDFPEGSPFRADSEKYVALLKHLTSPYGTPYKIFRMKMITRSMGEDRNYRAYLNAFLSDHALYFPTYGDSGDEEAAAVFQKALPGYEIVGVDNGNTEWGDSVHCRSRNLLKKNTIFIFPKVDTAVSGQPIEVTAEILASPGAQIAEAVVHWNAAGVPQTDIPLQLVDSHNYRALLPAQDLGTAVSLSLSVKDTAGITKTAPLHAPDMLINFTVQR
jgi:agmatine/peptidylarginine deiminase